MTDRLFQNLDSFLNDMLLFILMLNIVRWTLGSTYFSTINKNLINPMLSDTYEILQIKLLQKH